MIMSKQKAGKTGVTCHVHEGASESSRISFRTLIVVIHICLSVVRRESRKNMMTYGERSHGTVTRVIHTHITRVKWYTHIR